MEDSGNENESGSSGEDEQTGSMSAALKRRLAKVDIIPYSYYKVSYNNKNNNYYKSRELKWHYHIKDVAGTLYKIKRKRIKKDVCEAQCSNT